MRNEDSCASPFGGAPVVVYKQQVEPFVPPFCLPLAYGLQSKYGAALQDRQKGGFKKEVEEEYEDSQGNVYNRKTYEDLKRQGLI